MLAAKAVWGPMPSDAKPPRPIYHLALHHEWDKAATLGDGYRRSTLGTSLADEGFNHCSFGHQVQRIADLVYRGRDDVLLLTIDPGRLDDEVRVETPDGGVEGFPHLYGPLPIDAVVRVEPVGAGPDGRLDAASRLYGAGTDDLSRR